PRRPAAVRGLDRGRRRARARHPLQCAARGRRHARRGIPGCGAAATGRSGGAIAAPGGRPAEPSDGPRRRRARTGDGGSGGLGRRPAGRHRPAAGRLHRRAGALSPGQPELRSRGGAPAAVGRLPPGRYRRGAGEHRRIAAGGPAHPHPLLGARRPAL
ncbi:LOW QUALITY PROTEIN: hypothetical protein HMPREF0005_05983, partial [Achromobacter xylosoxidans C54]